MAFVGNKVKNKIPVDMLYTIGLFHDCGIPLLAIKYPSYKELLVEANGEGITSDKLEMKYYQTSHAIIGYFVATSWNLPKDICQLILQHHEEDYLKQLSGSTDQIAFAVLKAAENMVDKAKRHSQSPDWLAFESDALDVLGISTEDYNDIIDDYIDLYV